MGYSLFLQLWLQFSHPHEVTKQDLIVKVDQIVDI